MMASRGWRGLGGGSQRPVVLAVAASDSAGMAGIQMDARVIRALGVHAATAVTATTAQNSEEFVALNAVTDDVLKQQLEAVMALQPVVVKMGVLATSTQVNIVLRIFKSGGLPLVFDPVMASSTGHAFIKRHLASKILKTLVPHCSLLTPNLAEAEWLTGIDTSTEEGMVDAAVALRKAGAAAVLVKGGHGDGARSRDYFSDGTVSFWLESPRQDVSNTRGSGCALASAISAALALGYEMTDAVVIGKMAVNQGLRQAYSCGDQRGPLEVTAFPGRAEDLPELVPVGERLLSGPFPDCGDQPLGLYPVVDRAAWLERLLPLGISTIQLRVKDLENEALRLEVRTAITLAKQYGARLFINDHWDLAMHEGAYGVHLGQEDLASADLERIRRAGLRLGISTHSHYEAARAHALRPSYIACGPVYPTTTKDMPWHPLGPDGLAYWSEVLRDYPVVAIGGINRERMSEVVAAGADGVAMITAISQAENPERATRELVAAFR